MWILYDLSLLCTWISLHLATEFLFVHRFMLDLRKENKNEYIKKVTAMASKVGLKVSIIW